MAPKKQTLGLKRPAAATANVAAKRPVLPQVACAANAGFVPDVACVAINQSLPPGLFVVDAGEFRHRCFRQFISMVEPQAHSFKVPDNEDFNHTLRSAKEHDLVPVYWVEFRQPMPTEGLPVLRHYYIDKFIDVDAWKDICKSAGFEPDANYTTA